MMRRQWSLAAAVLVLALSVAAWGAPPFAKVAPGNAIAYIAMRDIPATVAAARQHSAYAVWQEPSVQKFFEKARLAIEAELKKAEGETGMTLEEIGALFQGQAALYVTLGQDMTKPEVIFLLEAKDKADRALEFFDALYRAAVKESGVEGLQRTEIDLGGAKAVRIFNPNAADSPSLIYAKAGDVVVAGTPVAAVERALSALRDPPAASLAATKPFSDGMNVVSAESDFVLFVNAQHVVNLVRAFAAAKAVAEPGGPDVAKIVGALGLDGLGSIVIGNTVSSTETVSRMFLAVSGEPRGVVKMLLPKPGPLHDASEIPADAASFVAARFEPALIYDEIEKILGGISPDILSGWRQQQQQMGQTAGEAFSLRDDVLSVFGPRASVYTRIEPPYNLATSQQTVMSMDIRSKEAFTACWNKLQKVVPMITMFIQPQDYMGYQLFMMGPPQQMGAPQAEGMPPMPAFAVTQDRFLFSNSSEALRAHLRRVGKPGASLADSKDYQMGLNKLPADGRVAVTFGTPKGQTEMLIEALRSGQFDPILANFRSNPDAARILDLFDFSLLPPAEDITKHQVFSAGAVQARPDGLLFTGWSPARPQ